jgi:protein SCO1/2
VLAAAATWPLLMLPFARAHAAQALQVTQPQVEGLPKVPVLTMAGESRRLERELNTDAPLLLNFVFTTCSASCSVQTAMLAEVQRELAQRKRDCRFASITIDPDNDTPEQLRRFAQKHGVTTGWQFYTGRFDDLLRVQKHFDVYRGSKASHPPVLLLRRHARAPWVRAEGFPGAREVLALIDSLPAAA